MQRVYACPSRWAQWSFMSADLVIHLGLGHTGNYVWCLQTKTVVSYSNVNLVSSSLHFLCVHSLPKMFLVSYLQYISTHTPFPMTWLSSLKVSSQGRPRSRKAGHWYKIPCSMAGAYGKVYMAPTQIVVQTSYYSLTFQKVNVFHFPLLISGTSLLFI